MDQESSSKVERPDLTASPEPPSPQRTEWPEATASPEPLAGSTPGLQSDAHLEEPLEAVTIIPEPVTHEPVAWDPPESAGVGQPGSSSLSFERDPEPVVDVFPVSDASTQAPDPSPPAPSVFSSGELVDAAPVSTHTESGAPEPLVPEIVRQEDPRPALFANAADEPTPAPFAAASGLDFEDLAEPAATVSPTWGTEDATPRVEPVPGYVPPGGWDPEAAAGSHAAAAASAATLGPGQEVSDEEGQPEGGANWMLWFVCAVAGITSLHEAWDLAQRIGRGPGLWMDRAFQGYALLGVGLIAFAFEALRWGRRRRASGALLLVVSAALLTLAGVVCLILSNDPGRRI